MEKKTSKLSRIMALLGVIILLMTIIATLVVAIIRFEGSERIFRALLILDFVIPGLLWIYLTIFRWAKGRDISLQEKLDEIDKQNAIEGGTNAEDK